MATPSYPTETRKESLLRVTRRRPCPVCGKPDYCGVSADGGMAVCMRTPSNRPSRNGGYVHRLHNRRNGRENVGRYAGYARLGKALLAERQAKRDPAEIEKLHRLQVAAVRPGPLGELAGRLGVSARSLKRIGIGLKVGSAWSFPMRDAAENVIGLRYRGETGRKWSERGGREGIFMPADLPPRASALLIVEGPTDLAALLDLIGESPPLASVAAVGRPSCTGGVSILLELAKRLGVRRAALLADADAPGRRGADLLARQLANHGIRVRLATPPAKDVRQWRRSGATGADLLTLLKRPAVAAKGGAR